MSQVRAAEAFVRIIEIMATLRSPAGCPWDREQTIDSHDHEALREELGDFLFEAVFLAQLEQEAGRFSIADSLEAAADKLVRRHPHVFARDQGEPAIDSSGAVVRRWEEIKA